MMTKEDFFNMIRNEYKKGVTFYAVLPQTTDVMGVMFESDEFLSLCWPSLLVIDVASRCGFNFVVESAAGSFDRKLPKGSMQVLATYNEYVMVRIKEFLILKNLRCNKEVINIVLHFLLFAIGSAIKKDYFNTCKGVCNEKRNHCHREG
jgi:hypothetical protein